MTSSFLGQFQKGIQEFKATLKRDLENGSTEEEYNQRLKRFKREVNDAMEMLFENELQAPNESVKLEDLGSSPAKGSFQNVPVKTGSAPCNHPSCRNQTVCSFRGVEPTAIISANATPTPCRPMATPISPSDVLNRMRASISAGKSLESQVQATGISNGNTIDPSTLSMHHRMNGTDGSNEWAPMTDMKFQKNDIVGAIPRRAYPAGANAPSGISLMRMAGSRRSPTSLGSLPYTRRTASDSNDVNPPNSATLCSPFSQRSVAQTGVSINSAVPTFAGSVPQMPAVPPPMEWDTQELKKSLDLGLDQTKASPVTQSNGQITPTSTTSTLSQQQQQPEHEPRQPQPPVNFMRLDANTRAFLITPAARTQQRRYKRVYCGACSKHPEGFRGAHELDRHNQREHGTCKTVYYTIDISDDKKFLAACKNCRQKKIYNTDYNAAAHLRRYHFNKKLKTDSKEEKERKSNSDLPPMEEVRKWMRKCRIDKTKLKDQKFLIDQEDAIVPDLDDETVDAIAVEDSMSSDNGMVDDGYENEDTDGEGEDHEAQDVSGFEFPNDIDLGESADPNYTFDNPGISFTNGGISDDSQSFPFFFAPEENPIFKEHMRQMGISASQLNMITSMSSDPDGLDNNVGSFGTGTFDSFEFAESYESNALALSQGIVGGASLDMDFKSWGLM